MYYHASNIFIAIENGPKLPKTDVLPALNFLPESDVPEIAYGRLCSNT